MSGIKIKVCGMRYPENIKEIAGFEPDYMGFIFYDKSPRYVGEELDAMVFKDLPSSVRKVGVFVNDELERIVDKVKRYDLDYVQLHGDESPDFCMLLKDQKIGVIKAIRINTKEDILKSEEYLEVVDYILFDTRGKKFGGNGRKFDWELLNDYKSKVPFFLSGGLEEKNIDIDLKKKYSSLHAFDVNSGFEIEPGLKDEQALKKAIFNLREGR